MKLPSFFPSFPLPTLLLSPPRGKARHSTSPWSVWNYRKFSIYLSPSSCVYVCVYVCIRVYTIVYMYFIYIVSVLCVCVCVCRVCLWMLLAVYNTFTIITIRCSSSTIHLNLAYVYVYIYNIYIYNPKKSLIGRWVTPRHTRARAHAYTYIHCTHAHTPCAHTHTHTTFSLLHPLPHPLSSFLWMRSSNRIYHKVSIAWIKCLEQYSNDNHNSNRYDDACKWRSRLRVTFRIPHAYYTCYANVMSLGEMQIAKRHGRRVVAQSFQLVWKKRRYKDYEAERTNWQ